MRRALSIALCLSAVACGGRAALRADGGDALGPGTGAAGAGAAGSGAEGGAGVDGGAGEATAERAPTTTTQPGWVGLRRLTDAEYDNTMRDLLGVSTAAFRTFDPYGSGELGPSGFDNDPQGQGISLQRYQWTFATAVAAVDVAFSDPAIWARLVPCALASVDDECARGALRAFGLRAWRRPLTEDEIEGLVRVVRDARTAGLPVPLAQGFVALLTSEAFLFRVELDPAPDSPVPHLVTPFDLATRLSYLLWSSTPDDALLARAADGSLAGEQALRAEVKRMLADARADGFVRNFVGQWLDFRRLEIWPLVWWPAGVQAAAFEEARRFVEMIVAEDRPLAELLTADVNFVDAALASHYGLAAPGAAGVTRVSVTTDARKGYLGLVVTLALASHETETSPTLRGTFVRERLLCQPVPPPPNAGPGHLGPPPAGATPRERAVAVAALTPCAPCHKLMDPIGLGLESFDQLGRFRTSYANGAAVDPTGELDGAPFSGVVGLADRLAADPGFSRCAIRKALSYALGRRIEDFDMATVDRLGRTSAPERLTVRGLLTAIVVDDVFRFRRGGGPL